MRVRQADPPLTVAGGGPRPRRGDYRGPDQRVPEDEPAGVGRDINQPLTFGRRQQLKALRTGSAYGVLPSAVIQSSEQQYPAACLGNLGDPSSEGDFLEGTDGAALFLDDEGDHARRCSEEEQGDFFENQLAPNRG